MDVKRSPLRHFFHPIIIKINDPGYSVTVESEFVLSVQTKSNGLAHKKSLMLLLLPWHFWIFVQKLLFLLILLRDNFEKEES